MPENSDLSGQNILLGITGGIAAYKTPMLVRQLVEAGANIQVEHGADDGPHEVEELGGIHKVDVDTRHRVIVLRHGRPDNSIPGGQPSTIAPIAGP